MAAYRMDRIEEEVKKALSAVIRELKDPRICELVSVIAVEITKDLRFAKAHISVFGNEEQQKNTIEGLKAAAGFIRREIGHRVNLRANPEFTFKLDNSIEYGAHINKLIGEVINENKNSESDK